MTYKLQVAIVDYEIGNLFSVKHACDYVGLSPVITSDKSIIMNSDAVILPGVGAFGDAMNNLRKLDLIEPLKAIVDYGKPFMGICLGMQLLFSESEEFGIHKGLDIIKGYVRRFSTDNNEGKKVKVPQVGWNQIYRPSFVTQDCWNRSLLKNIDNGEFMYFVHSFYSLPEDSKYILSTTIYENVEYCSGVFWKNVFAFQFHPEKSTEKGITVFKNFKIMLTNGGSTR